MAKRLLLHIGLPKTGTTAIQRALAAQGDLLRRNGIYYPRSAGGPVAQLLHRAALAPQGARRMRPAVQDRLEDFTEALRTEIGALPESVQTVVLSSEQCGLFLRTPAQMEALRNLLAPWFDTIQVLIYLRRQDAHAASLYAQMLRRGMIAEPVLQDIAGGLNGLYDYETLLRDWVNAFGAGCIIPRIFERASLPHGDVVEDFLMLCGISQTDAAQPGRVDINPSINENGQALLRALGARLKARGELRQINDPIWPRLAALVSQTCAGPGWYPAPAEAAAFMARFDAGNEAVRQTYFPARAHLFDTTRPLERARAEAPSLADAAAETILAVLMQGPAVVARPHRRRGGAGAG